MRLHRLAIPAALVLAASAAHAQVRFMGPEDRWEDLIGSFNQRAWESLDFVPQSFRSVTISEFNPSGSTYLQLDDVVYSRTGAPVGNGPPAWLNIPPSTPDGNLQGKP